MTKSLDQLIGYLLDEIGAVGPAGVSIPQLLGLVKTFYDGDQCVDNRLLAQVWRWLGRHPDISIGAARKFNQTPLEEFQVDPTDPLTSWKSRSPKVHASEELIYRSICGHSRQEAQLFPLEHALLMQIAASRANGIMQGDLGRQTGQDKRSVPKRTDFLCAKGYILKLPVINKGTKTSLLILRRYAHCVAAPTSTTATFLVRDVLQQLSDRLSDGSPIELTKLVDIIGDEGETAKKVLSRILRVLEKVGCYKRVKTAFGPSAHSSDLKTVVQQIRAPSDEDLLSLEQGPLALDRPVIDLLNEEKKKKLDQASRTLSPWNPDRLLVNQLQDMVQSIAPGFEVGARKALLGPFLQTAISPATPSPSSLSRPSRVQTIKPASPPAATFPASSPATQSHLLSKQIQDVQATNLIPRSEEPHILRDADGLEVVQPIARAKSPDSDPAETPKRRPKRQKGEKKVRTRIIETDEEMRPQGRPRRFLRGTEKFWQHHFWQAKLAEVGDRNVPVKKVGIMQDPAGIKLFESRPHDFDETLVQAIAAGLPIPATPDAINSDWVRDTRAVLDRNDNGADGAQRADRFPIAVQDGIPDTAQSRNSSVSNPGQVKAPDVCVSQTTDQVNVDSERLDGRLGEQPEAELEQILQTRQGRGGDVSICQEILLELVQLARGAAPYNRTTLQRCMAARWQANGGTGYRPLMKVIKSAVARLVESEKVREHTFSFRGKGGAMIKRSILHFASVPATSAQISELKESIMVADTTEYIPQEWATVMLPPGKLVDRTSRARKHSVSEQSPDANAENCSDEDRGSARSRRAPKRRKIRHESPSNTRQVTPLSEATPTSTPAQSFLTLKVPKLGILPQVQDYNSRVSARERMRSEAAVLAADEWSDAHGADQRNGSVYEGRGRNVIWVPQPILPASLDDLLRVEHGNQAPDDSAVPFFQQVDMVAKWERREAQSILGRKVPWRFFNHMCSIRDPSPSAVTGWFLVHFDQDSKLIEREWVDFPGWNGLKAAQQPQASADTGITGKGAGEGRRLTRQATGAIKKTRWTGLDDPLELENGTGRIRSRKRRRTAPAIMATQNLSGESDWEGEGWPIHSDRRPKKKARTGARSRPSPRLEGKDLGFACGVLCVRSLVGGIEQHVDWGIVQSISPDLDEKAAQDRWKTLLSKHREEIDNLVQQFQDKYVTAFDQGEAPPVDFENLGQTDWQGIVAWAEANLTTLGTQTVPEPPLAASRKELLADLALELQRARDLDSVYDHGMAMNNSAKDQLYSAVISGVSASDILSPKAHYDPRLAVARSYVLSTVLTPEVSFDPKQAEEKLLCLESVGEESKTALRRAVNSLYREKMISRQSSDTLGPLGLRQWKVSNIFADVMESRRQANRTLLRAAADYKTQVLDPGFGAGERVSVPKEAIVDDGIMLAILNLVSQGQIAIRPGSDAPHSRYGIDWESAGYQTRLIDRSKAIFTAMLSPTKAYIYGHPMQNSRLERVPRGDMDQPGGPIPLWIDIHGNVMAEWWETAVAAVLGLLNVRPGLSAEACGRMLNWTLTSHDIGLVKRQVKIITEQKIIPGADSGVAGFPLRHWSIQIKLYHAETKQEVEADVFDKVTYILHESFGEKMRQEFTKPPFRVAEDGWGEFELGIELHDAAGKSHSLSHDLNFQSSKYEVKHSMTFKNVKPNTPIWEKLRLSGPLPGENANGDSAGGKKRASEIGASAAGGAQKKKKAGDGKSVDMDKLAEGLQRLGEDDLLQVVQMVHDNKTEDSWMRNDVEQGEFHVDLYTLPDTLINMLWTFTKEKNAIDVTS
ncbi:hypothetical protein DV735_g30, partial [Chaetothyriales sp. CBS 134920]